LYKNAFNLESKLRVPITNDTEQEASSPLDGALAAHYTGV